MPRHFLTGTELSSEELLALLARARELKLDRGASRALEGRSVALVFEQPSTRTRISFEVGVSELGGHPLVLRPGEMQLSRGESPRDTALVLSRYVHAVAVRAAEHALLEELAASSSVPVVNMLTAEHHPCQVLADLLTLEERFGTLQGLKLAYVGDFNNVTRSLITLGALVGVEVAVAAPAELRPEAVDSSATILEDPARAVEGAHPRQLRLQPAPLAEFVDRRLADQVRRDVGILSRRRQLRQRLLQLSAVPWL